MPSPVVLTRQGGRALADDDLATSLMDWSATTGKKATTPVLREMEQLSDVTVDTGEVGGARAAAPSDTANVVSSALLWWMTPVVARGAAAGGEGLQGTLPALPLRYRMDTVAPRAQLEWHEEVQRAERERRVPQYERMLWRMWRGVLVRGLLWAVVAGLSSAVAKPLVLLRLITAIEDGEADATLVWHVVGLFAGLAVEGVALAQSRHWLADHFGAAYVVTTASLVHSKVLSTPGGQSGSKEMSLFGTDCLRARSLFENLIYLPIGVATLVAGTAVMVFVAGWVSLIGLGTSLVLLVVSMALNARVRKMMPKMLRSSEARVGLTAQIVEGIKAIKFSAWEESFQDVVTKAREVELAYFGKHRTAMMTAVALGRSTPVLASCATFVSLSFLGYDLRGGELFSTYVVFFGLRVAFGCIPYGITHSQTVATVGERFAEYLKARPAQKFQPPEEPDVPLAISDAVFERFQPFCPKLKVPGVVARRGEVTAVVGRTGSGKSTLISAVLGDMQLRKGSARRTTSIGYVPQASYVLSGTVTENVVMGREYDRARVEDALRAAALLDDVLEFDGGADAHIGERGGTLSGGQQHRLSIARAVYDSPTLLVLDDPLAAVDPRVAGELFWSLKKYAQRGHAVVMVLNQPLFFPECDSMVVVDGLQVGAQGSYEALSGTSDVLVEMMHSPSASPSQSPRGSPASPVSLSAPEVAFPRRLPRSHSRKSVRSQPAAARGADRSFLVSPSLFREEGSADGAVSWRVYAAYFRAIGWGNVALAVAVCALTYGCLGFTDRWLATWVDAQNDYRALQENATTRGNATAPNNVAYAVPYISGAVGSTVLMMLYAVVTTRAFSGGSLRMHNDVLDNLMYAPLSWFQQTPSGRILSRLSADLGVIDGPLTHWVDYCLTFLCAVLNLCVVLILVAPPLAVVLAACVVVCWAQMRLVEATNCAIKRLATAATSPVLSALSEILKGRTLLRSMGFHDFSHRRIADRLDAMTQYAFVSNALTSWQSLWTYVIYAALSAGAAVYMVLHKETVSPSDTGLVLTYCFMLPYFTLFLALNIGFVRLNMTAVERLLQYAGEEVDREPARTTPEDPPEAWPAKGCIEFKDAVLTYRKGTKPALDGVNLTIAAQQRVGIVGRTGAGKSSLLVLLFRLVDAASGTITIDGVDIRRVGLRTLRKRLAIIPQEPLLLQGTLRDNLDPFRQLPDDAIKSALRRLDMHHLPLDTHVGSDSDTLSAGQRQLVSIARALLRRDVKFVVLDEPTSSIDPTTDAIVQRVIREEFAGCTVLTIAHRLSSVLDGDAIVVMAGGKVAEMGPPGELLDDPQSHLSRMLRGGDDVDQLPVALEEVQLKAVSAPVAHVKI